MKIDRLIGILSILLQKEMTTAPELSNEKVFPQKGRVKAVFDPSMKWQLVEEYGVDSFTEMDDGSLLFEHEYADDEGLLAWMLSCRDMVTVLEPERIREKLYQITSEIARRYEGEKMKNTALVVIDLQNDITKNYKKIIGQVNVAIDWAAANEMHVIYIKHYNLSEKTRTFKPDTKGAELVPEMKVVSDNIFAKTKANSLTSEELSEFIDNNGINGFYIAGADATGCVKSTCFNMAKAGYKVHVISDCVTSYDLKKLDEMYAYYANKGCEVKELKDYMEGA